MLSPRYHEIKRFVYVMYVLHNIIQKGSEKSHIYRSNDFTTSTTTKIKSAPYVLYVNVCEIMCYCVCVCDCVCLMCI